MKCAIDKYIQELGKELSKYDSVKASEVLASLQNVKEYEGSKPLQMKVYGTTHKEVGGTEYSKYAKMMQDLVQREVKPLVKDDADVVLSSITQGLDELIAGEYDPDKHEIKVAIMPNKVAIDQAAQDTIDSVYYEYVEDVPDKKLVEYMKNDPMYKALQGQKQEVAKNLVNDIENMIKYKGVYTLTHEFIHAGAARHMKVYPDSEATKRIKELFEKAKNPRYKAKINKYFTNKDNMDYWRTNVDEFLAEALSNPQLMAGLQDVEIEISEGKISNIFKELYDTVMEILRLGRKDSLYNYVLDGYLALIEEQKRLANLTPRGKSEVHEKLRESMQREARILGSKEVIDKELGKRLKGKELYVKMRKNAKSVPDTAYKPEEKYEITDARVDGTNIELELGGKYTFEWDIAELNPIGNNIMVGSVVSENGTTAYAQLNGLMNEVEADYVFQSTKKYVEDEKKAEFYRSHALETREGILEILDEVVELDGDRISKEYVEYLKEVVEKIDPRFIPRLKLYLDTQADENYGNINGTSLNVFATQNEISYGNEMSASEVYTHELVHSITKFALEMSNSNSDINVLREKLVFLRDESQKKIEEEAKKEGKESWEIFLPETSLDAKKEAEEAKRMYEYIFEHKNSLHEFVAHGMTNEKFKDKLESFIIKEKEEEKNFLERIKDLFDTLIKVVLGKVGFDEIGKNYHENVMQLTFELMQHNNKAMIKKERRSEFGSKLEQILDKSNRSIGQFAEYFTKKAESEDIVSPPKNATRLQMAKWMARWLPQLMLRADMEGKRELVAYVFGMKPEGTVMNVLRDIKTPDELERVVEQLGLDSDQIDRHKMTAEKLTRDVVRKGFSRRLEIVEEEALTSVLLDTDMAELLGKEDIEKVLSDEKYLNSRIKELQNELYKDKEYGKWYVNQARGLGYYMATHFGGIAQNLNSENIARKMLLNKKIDNEVDENVKDLVDRLSTLVALTYTPTEAKTVVKELAKSENEGVIKMLELHNGIKEESRKLFNTGAHIIKGYVKEIFDDSIDLKIKPISMEEELVGQGYELVRELDKSDNDRSTEKLGLYRSKFYVNQSYNRAAARMTDLHKKGTSLVDIQSISLDKFAKEKAKISRSKMDRERVRVAKAMKEGTYDPKQDSGINVPVIDENGNVVDYRYMMGKEEKKKLLLQETDASTVLGRTFASIQDKIGTEEQNKAVLEVIQDDMVKNYIPGEAIGKNGKFYIRIAELSEDAAVRDIYRILPENVKQAVKESKNGYIAVRRDMLHNYFGFRDATFTDFFGLNRLTPPVVKKAIIAAEMLWKEIVTISKVDIVIRTPMVFIGNVVSNFMYHVIDGENPFKVLGEYRKHVANLNSYLKVEQEIQELKLKEVVSKVEQKRIKVLENELKKNPVHDLMEAGMYQAIVEEIDRRDMKASTRLGKRLDKITEGQPEFLRQGAHWLYLSERTNYFQFMTKATQYSDFIARATQYERMRKKGIDKTTALRAVLDVFVNYNKPASKLEEYLNDMGLFMFTKYMKRIQRAVFRDIKKKPMNVLLAFLGQEALFDVDDIYDQGLFVRNYSNINQDLWDHFQRFYTPTTLEYLGIAK